MHTYLKSDAKSGSHYVDLNAAMTGGYRGAWLYGSEHIVTHVGKLRAEWEQFCPVPADIRDGILLKGNVFYRHNNGNWVKSPDRYEGVLRTVHGANGGRYFVGRTQHTFHSRRFKGGSLRVQAHLNIRLSHRAPSNPLFKVPARNKALVHHYQRRTYTEPTLSYPSYQRSVDDASQTF